jgi:hypothetical protein
LVGGFWGTEKSSKRSLEAATNGIERISEGEEK